MRVSTSPPACPKCGSWNVAFNGSPRFDFRCCKCGNLWNRGERESKTQPSTLKGPQ